MILYLVQHGEAKSEAEDPERSLSEAPAQVWWSGWQSGRHGDGWS